MSSPFDPRRPDDGGQPGPGAHPSAPPHVYNPYGDYAYPATYPTYPTPPAGLGPDDTVLPVRRPGAVTLGLVLAVLSALPYLLIGLLAVAAAGAVESAVPPGQLAQLQQMGVDLEQLVRTTGTLLLVVAALFVLLAVLSWTGRRWARALLAAMTAGFVLMMFVSVAAASAQGVPVDGGSLVVIAGPVLLAVAAVASMFGSAARAWFAGRRPPRA